MIPKAVILKMAKEQDLFPTTMEKDYALGWILHGIARHPIASKWIFKGGTCLKKCFFDTYRFSEDLDFTIPNGQPYEYDSILSTIAEIARWVESETGILFPIDGISLEEYENLRGNTSFQGKATFVGPLQMSRKSLQRIKFDLTQDEVLADTPVPREVFHPYADASFPAPHVLCYSVNEIMAEKTRALYERQGRARDVYDVVHICRAFRDSVNPVDAVNALKIKFDFKGLPKPSVELILERIDEGVLRANWTQQLEHQLPVLPDVGSFIDSLPNSLSWWLEPAQAAPLLSPIPGGIHERTAPREPYHYRGIRREPGLGMRRSSAGIRSISGTMSFDRIIFAAHNRLCIQVKYKNIRRLVEPYSLRYPSTGNVLLYVWELDREGVRTNQKKALRLDAIEDVQVTKRPFTPRFEVEL